MHRFGLCVDRSGRVDGSALVRVQASQASLASQEGAAVRSAGSKFMPRASFSQVAGGPKAHKTSGDAFLSDIGTNYAQGSDGVAPAGSGALEPLQELTPAGREHSSFLTDWAASDSGSVARPDSISSVATVEEATARPATAQWHKCISRYETATIGASMRCAALSWHWRQLVPALLRAAPRAVNADSARVAQILGRLLSINGGRANAMLAATY